MNDKVGGLALLKRSYLACEVEAPCRVDGCRYEGFAGVIFICVQASDITTGMDAMGEEPGLKSVAKTTASPASIMARAGA